MLLIGLILTIIPQMLVKSTYSKYEKIPVEASLTGAKVAEMMLKDANITNVSIEHTSGYLTDHYDPRTKVIRLSDSVYSGNSIAAIGVAAHETGHAIQDNKGYVPMQVRAAILPITNLGSSLGGILIIAGLFLRMLSSSNIWFLCAVFGIFLYGFVVLFHFVTLPVELNASGRALKILSENGYLEKKEISGARNVLGAAAFTYVAVALYALIELLYWILRIMGSRNR
jgi:Zn-dependent membrane protease YugP